MAKDVVLKPKNVCRGSLAFGGRENTGHLTKDFLNSAEYVGGARRNYLRVPPLIDGGGGQPGEGSEGEPRSLPRGEGRLCIPSMPE